MVCNLTLIPLQRPENRRRIPRQPLLRLQGVQPLRRHRPPRHQFIPADKKDSKYSYKKAKGYSPGVATVGGLIVGVENRDGNANVRFHYADTLRRIIGRFETEGGGAIRNFRGDSGSFLEAIIDCVKDHCEHFYVCAGNCRSRRTEFMEHKNWAEVIIGGTEC